MIIVGKYRNLTKENNYIRLEQLQGRLEGETKEKNVTRDITNCEEVFMVQREQSYGVLWLC